MKTDEYVRTCVNSLKSSAVSFGVYIGSLNCQLFFMHPTVQVGKNYVSGLHQRSRFKLGTMTTKVYVLQGTLLQYVR